MTSTFPDTMFVVFVGTEGHPLFSANHSTEPEALEMLEKLNVRHPTTSFGVAEYRRVDAPSARVP